MRSWLAVVLAAVVAAAVVVAAVVVPGVADELRGRPDRGDEAVMGGPAVEVEATGLDEVVDTDDEEPQHTEGEVDYPDAPPMAGRHAPYWQACGVYDEPVREESTVHALEHGTVWITYDPALPESEVEVLEALLPDEGILSPYPDLRRPVVVTVWDRQLALSGARDPGLRAFLDEYGDGSTAPEPMASCLGGIEAVEAADVGGTSA